MASDVGGAPVRKVVIRVKTRRVVETSDDEGQNNAEVGEEGAPPG